MTEYIEREAAIDAIMKVYVRTAGYKARERVFEAKEAVHRLPVADVAPVSELLTLRDALYENDQITMRGLARLNMLIAKYGGYDHG